MHPLTARLSALLAVQQQMRLLNVHCVHLANIKASQHKHHAFSAKLVSRQLLQVGAVVSPAVQVLTLTISVAWDALLVRLVSMLKLRQQHATTALPDATTTTRTHRQRALTVALDSTHQ